jgi:hypothetical protein
MGTINSVNKRVQQFSLLNESMVVVDDMKGKMVELNKEQMLAGKNKQGGYLPRYVDDNYFKSTAAALRYQRWKSYISPNKSKPVEVMDFFIVGYYHRTVEIKVLSQGYELFSDAGFANSIESKTSGTHLGLNAESRVILLDDGFRDKLRKRIEDSTGL